LLKGSIYVVFTPRAMGILRNKGQQGNLYRKNCAKFSQMLSARFYAQTVSLPARFLYNTARFPLLRPMKRRPALQRREIFDDGNSAWFARSVGISCKQTADPLSGRSPASE
ncbi:hypothetical protein QMZ20_25640, partial [Serratia bockelmannii]|nr:hypothetical protein [Serratia bockelmannii]